MTIDHQLLTELITIISWIVVAMLVMLCTVIIALTLALRRKDRTFRHDPLATGVYRFTGSGGEKITIIDTEKLRQATMHVSRKGSDKVERVQAAFTAARRGRGLFGLEKHD